MERCAVSQAQYQYQSIKSSSQITKPHAPRATGKDRPHPSTATELTLGGWLSCGAAPCALGLCRDMDGLYWLRRVPCDCAVCCVDMA